MSSTTLAADDVQKLSPGDYEVFEPLVEDPKQLEQSLTFYAAHDEIWFYTWGDTECCLPLGATSATLQDYAPDINAEQEYLQEELAEDEGQEDQEGQEGQEYQEPGKPQTYSTSEAQQSSGQSYTPYSSYSAPPPVSNGGRLKLKIGDFLL